MCRLPGFCLFGNAGFDLSRCPSGIHALKFVRPTQDWLSFIIWDRLKTDQKKILKSIPEMDTFSQQRGEQLNF